MLFIFISTIFTFVSFHEAADKLGARSVNLAIETSLILDPKDARKLLSFIEGIKKFLDKIQASVTPEASQSKTEHNVLKNFLSDFGKVLIKYKNKDLRKLTRTIKNVINEYENNTTFQEIFIDEKLNTYINDVAIDWSKNPIKLKNIVINLLKNDKNNTYSEVVTNLNEFYTNGNNLQVILEKFSKYPENHDDLNDLVKQAVNSIIIEPYKKLNNTDKKVFVKVVDKLRAYLPKDETTPKLLIDSIADEIDSSKENVIEEEKEISNSNETEEKEDKNEKDNEIFMNEDMEISVNAPGDTVNETRKSSGNANSKIVDGNVKLSIKIE